MTHPKLPPDYSWVTMPCDIVPSEYVPSSLALPAVIEPTTMPFVLTTNDEPLVHVVHRKIRSINAYWHTGWSAAFPHMMVREGASRRLRSVAENLLPEGFGLAIMDAWRSTSLQQEIYGAFYYGTEESRGTPDLPKGFITPPSYDPRTPAPHLTGGTVDITLTWRGHPLHLGTHFDDFSPASHLAAYEDTPGAVRDLRRLLYWTMHHAGFVGYQQEWWHFEYGTRRWAAVKEQDPIYGAIYPE